MTIRLDAVAALVLLSACADAANPADPPGWTLEPEFTVGSLDGPDAFGSVQSIVADSLGRLYVADGQAAVITVFDSLGRWAGAMGRFGSGPGEIGALQSLAWLGDTLAVMDPGNARIGLFRGEGTWAGQLPHQPIGGSALDVRFYRAGRSAWAVQLDRRTTPPPRLYVHFTSAGPADTVADPQGERARAPGLLCEGSDGGLRFFRTPFAMQHLLAFSPDGDVLRLATTEYAAVITSRSGDTVRAVTRDMPRAVITDAEWDSASAAMRGYRASDPAGRCDGDYVRPDRKPAVRFVMYDADGRLWIERITALGFAWDVWQGDSLVGSVPGPDRDPAVEPYARGRRLYVVTRDSLGLQGVNVFRIRQAATRQ